MSKHLWRALVALAVCLSVIAVPSAADASPWWWPVPPPPPPTTPPPPPAPTCLGDPIYKADGTAWTCTLDDEFSGTKVDSTNWNVMTSATGAPVNGPACYTSNATNVSVSGGYLYLTARKEAAPFSCALPNNYKATTQYTGGEIATNNKFSQTYGRFAVRASFPKAAVAGLQSALWLYPNNTLYGAWPLSGELDIAEQYSAYNDRVIPYLHYNFDATTANASTNTNVVTNNFCLINDVSAFHEYAVEWTKTAITILYDGSVCLVDKPAALGLTGMAPFDQPFFLLLTQALGITGNAFDPAKTPLPATTRVDYVRVWK